MKHTLDIAIAGAGIGGLTAAAALARSGHHVQVFDRFEAPRPVGSGLVIQPVGQQVLAEIGAIKTALAHGRPIWRMHGIEAVSGRDVLKVDYGLEQGDRFGLAIQRPALFDAVLDAAMQAGATLVPAHQINDQKDGHLIFDGAAPAGPFDLIIDALGANSCLSPLQGKALPYGAIWATVPWSDALSLPRGQLSQRYRRADRMVGIMPSGTRPGDATDSATIFWSLPADGLETWRAAGLEVWLDDVEALWPEAMPIFSQITDADQMTFARYTHGTLASTTAPGFAIIGDAAHRASPQLGQGANMAMLDAMALATAVDLFPLDEALRQYRMARRWHVWIYQTMSRAFTPQYQSNSRFLPVLRDRLLYPLSTVPPIPRILNRLVCGDLIPPMASLSGNLTEKSGK